MKEDYIKKLVNKVGAANVIKAFEVLGLVKPQGEVSTQGNTNPPECITGYYWSETLKRCVLDIG